MWHEYPKQPAVSEGRNDQGSGPSPESQWTFEDAYKPKTIPHPKQPRNQVDPAPQRTKRTRTVITPHQTSFLRELLAQSLFPSTAAKEEAGRAIGLSARSVQIWFQNQRQRTRGQRKPLRSKRASTPNVSASKYVGIAPPVPQTYPGGSPMKSIHLEPSFPISSPANNNLNSQTDFCSSLQPHLPSVTSHSHVIQRRGAACSSSSTFAGPPQILTSSELPTQCRSYPSGTLPPKTQGWSHPPTSILPPPVPFRSLARSQPSHARLDLNSHASANWQPAKSKPALVLQTETQRGNNFLPAVPPTTSSPWRTRTLLDRPSCRAIFEATDNLGIEGLYRDVRDAYEYDSSPGLRNGRYDPVRGTMVSHERSATIHYTTLNDRTLLPVGSQTSLE
ncbi:hypothetical protein PM082_021366 [Marasmius tenuissimus]|nr:hypothetical protein PM082_021366 [Marasmius tenuissimus]